MAGMNLTLSTAEKMEESKGIFDGSLTIISVIFFLVVASWGGMRWYIKTLDDRLANLDATLAQSSAQLQGDKVNRVAYFDARSGFAEQQLKDVPIDAKKLLGQLESLTVPNVRLTKYEYNEMGKFVVVEGETDNFRYIAEQVISLKSEALFAEIKVDSVQRNREGRIEFSLKAGF
jgi:hypothetical protein